MFREPYKYRKQQRQKEEKGVVRSTRLNGVIVRRDPDIVVT